MVAALRMQTPAQERASYNGNTQASQACAVSSILIARSTSPLPDVSIPLPSVTPAITPAMNAADRRETCGRHRRGACVPLRIRFRISLVGPYRALA